MAFRGYCGAAAPDRVHRTIRQCAQQRAPSRRLSAPRPRRGRRCHSLRGHCWPMPDAVSRSLPAAASIGFPRALPSLLHMPSPVRCEERIHERPRDGRVSWWLACSRWVAFTHGSLIERRGHAGILSHRTPRDVRGGGDVALSDRLAELAKRTKESARSIPRSGERSERRLRSADDDERTSGSAQKKADELADRAEAADARASDWWAQIQSDWAGAPRRSRSRRCRR